MWRYLRDPTLRLAVSVEHRLVTERHTDIHRHSMASCGKNPLSFGSNRRGRKEETTGLHHLTPVTPRRLLALVNYYLIILIFTSVLHIKILFHCNLLLHLVFTPF